MQDLTAPLGLHPLRIPGLPSIKRGPAPGALTRVPGPSRLGLRRPRRSRLATCPSCRSLDFLAKGVVAGLALLPRCERRRGGAALLLILVVLGFRLLLFLVASHLTLRHGVLQLIAALPRFTTPPSYLNCPGPRDGR